MTIQIIYQNFLLSFETSDIKLPITITLSATTLSSSLQAYSLQPPLIDINPKRILMLNFPAFSQFLNLQPRSFLTDEKQAVRVNDSNSGKG